MVFPWLYVFAGWDNTAAGRADTANPPCDLDSSSSYGSSMIGQLLWSNCVTRLRETGQNIVTK